MNVWMMGYHHLMWKIYHSLTVDGQIVLSIYANDESWHSFPRAGRLNVMAFVKRSWDSTVKVARYGPLLKMLRVLVACLGNLFICAFKKKKVASAAVSVESSVLWVCRNTHSLPPETATTFYKVVCSPVGE